MTSVPAGHRERFLALVSELRPELHRYCARLTGSVFDGEDIVQDTLARGLAAVDDLDALPALRPWLFRIAHNRALDVLRARALRSGEPLDAALDLVDAAAPGTDEVLLRAEAVRTAVSRFIELPVTQRSVVILKDVLDHSLDEIASLLQMTVNAVKGALARGRARLAELNAAPALATPAASPPSPAVARYVALFNARAWDALRALLADDVRLNQSGHWLRTGPAEVGTFFTGYAASADWRIAPGWLEGREVVAVFEPACSARPSYATELVWRDGRLAVILDFRYARYVASDVEIHVAPGADRGGS